MFDIYTYSFIASGSCCHGNITIETKREPISNPSDHSVLFSDNTHYLLNLDTCKQQKAFSEDNNIICVGLCIYKPGVDEL